MKNVLFASLIILFINFSCEETECCVHPPVLQGNWILIEEKVSDGGPASWEDVSDGYRITFNEDGTFTSGRFLDCKEGTYTFTEDEITYNFSCDDFTEPFVDHYEFENGTLLLYMVSPYRCIEECLYRFERK